MSTYVRFCRLPLAGAGLCLSALLLFAQTQPEPVQAPRDAQDQPQAQSNGLTVLARGPVHEAFAEPQQEKPQPGPVITREAPPVIDEVPPDQKPEGENVQWIPGYWQWDDDRNDFIWVSGVWRDVPPGRRWVPGFYQQVQGGYQWVAGYWQPEEQQEVTYLPQPPESVEEGPSSPVPDDSVYVPGCWIYRETRYLWRPGYFIARQPGWVWCPSHYLYTPAGCLFVDGFWDYGLAHRGLMFAPCAVDLRVAYQPGWTYVPSYAVPWDFLPSALFVRPNWCHYYFGDYFANAYVRAGFTPWIDYRIGRFAYDPLFGHYSFARDDRWVRNLRDLYTARFEGRAPLPPRTLVQENTLIQNIHNNTVNNITNIRQVTPLVHLSQVTHHGVQLAPVQDVERRRVYDTVRQYGQIAQERRKIETRTIGREGRSVPLEQPRSVRWQVEHPAAQYRGGGQAPPPNLRGRENPNPNPEKGLPPIPHTPGPEHKTPPPREPEPRPQPNPNPPPREPQPRPEPRPQPNPNPPPREPQPRPEPRPEPRPQPNPNPPPREPQPRPEPRPQPNPAPEHKTPPPPARGPGYELRSPTHNPAPQPQPEHRVLPPAPKYTPPPEHRVIPPAPKPPPRPPQHTPPAVPPQEHKAVPHPPPPKPK